jgi:iron complex transport system substrate-binding protein
LFKLRFNNSIPFVNRILVLLASIVLISGLIIGSGCQRNNATTATKADKVSTFPLSMTDDLGRMVTVEHLPQRIVSLAPSNTEIVYALGLSDKLVGVTQYCDYPVDALSKEKVGGYSDINIEKVISLKPDLILAEDIHKKEVIPALERLGFTCYALVPHNLDEIMNSVLTIGKLTGANKEAQDIVSDMQQRIKYITDKTAGLSDAARLRVLYVIWHEPIMSVGGNTPMHEMIVKVGGASIVNAATTGFPTLSLEEVINSNPQVIVANVEDYPGGDAPLKGMLAESRLKVVEAVAKGKVYGINASLVNRSVPRIIEGLEWLAAIVHPELFPEFVSKYIK